MTGRAKRGSGQTGGHSQNKDASRFLTIGVMGGMGPEATSLFFSLLVKSADAARDQDHVPIVVCSFPQMPDRVAHILGNGPSPVPMMINVLKTLRVAGADFAIMPCITAHYFFPVIAARSPIPIINIVEETAAYVSRRNPEIKKIGLLATSGTVSTGIFHRAFEAAGISVLAPDSSGQARVMDAIYGGIKAGVVDGAPRRNIIAEATALVRRGAQGIVAGCTEIPLALKQSDIPVPLIEPMQIAARVAIERAGGKVKPGRQSRKE